MNHTKPTSNTKTHRSVNNYINSLHDQYSKILAIRVDLGYLKEHSEQVLLPDIKKDVKKLLDNRRGKPSIFQDQVGYVVKYENAPDKGPHAHALFLYDGQHVQKDAYIGDQIGKYWSENITAGRGVHHNCNRDKDKYKDCGIGMINHADSHKRENLLNHVVPYMLKADQSIDDLRENGRERAITKGITPKPKSGAGRPRSSH
ncbi:YagK/YfjJ domain-containing protein [Acidovorax temperans]|uniref:YagK/YfjJ domain-containing protein n=1 Tax=Acidovorax temperans TaxID=80878 RepID=UPI0030CCACA2